jgi:hypothetical protein
MTAWIDPRAPRRPPLCSPAFRRRLALRRFAAACAAGAELAAVSAFVAGLLAMLDALTHL